MLRDIDKLPGLFLTNENPTVPDLVNGHLPNIARPLSGVEEEVEPEPLIRSDGPFELKRFDLMLSPGVEAVAPVSKHPHADSGIGTSKSAVHSEAHHRPQHLEHIVRRSRGRCHLIHLPANVPRFEHGYRVVAVLVPIAIKDAFVGALGVRLESKKITRSIVGHAQRVDGSWLDPARADLDRLGVRRSRIPSPPSLRAKRFGCLGFRETNTAKAPPHLPPYVAVVGNVSRLFLHAAASHGLSARSVPSSGKAQNASSKASRSHSLRPSIRFGAGIRPSWTSWSNLVTLIPI